MSIANKVIKEKWTKYVYMAMLTALFLFKPPLESPIDTASLTIYISIFFIATILHLLSQKDENWFRLDVLFLLGFGIVHFQWAIMSALSDIDINTFKYVMYGMVDTVYINYGTWLSTVGVLAWFIGYSWFKTKSKKYRVEYTVKYKKLYWFTSVLFVLFLLTAGSNFLSGGIYKGEGGGSAAEGIGAYFQLLFSISILLLTAVVILNSKISLKVKVIPWFLKLDNKYLILAGIYVLLFLSIGDRGAAIQVVMTFLVLFGALVRPISLKEFSILIVVGAIILTLIGLGRSATSGENILVAGADKVEFSSNYDVTQELANSSRTLYSALSEVPDYHDYFYGKLWLGNIMSVFPLLQNTYLKVTDDKAYELASSRYITYLRYGLKPPSGEGTSLIADIYLNFGLAGVIIFMFLLGMFIKKLQNEMNMQENFYWILAAGIFAGVVFYMGRGGLLDGLRFVLWGLFVAFLFVKRKVIIR